MSIFKQCQFYRARESLSMGVGIGYCDLDSNQVVCDGDIHFCEKPDALRKYLMEQKKKEGRLGAETRRNDPCSGGGKA